MHRPLSRQVWLTLKNINLLAPTRGQRGRNHLRRPKDKTINVITRVERQQIIPERRRSANQHNLLNIPVDTFAAKTSDRNKKGMNSWLKPKVNTACRIPTVIFGRSRLTAPLYFPDAANTHKLANEQHAVKRNIGRTCPPPPPPHKTQIPRPCPTDQTKWNFLSQNLLK